MKNYSKYKNLINLVLSSMVLVFMIILFFFPTAITFEKTLGWTLMIALVINLCLNVMYHFKKR